MQEARESDRCQFVESSASDLHPIKNSSVDVVTTRSVLIYVEDKQQAFREFYRVLKSRGRLSIFEPINRFNLSSAAHRRWGYDMEPVKGIWEKVEGVYSHLQPPKSDPMLNFDERDLMVFAEQAGFSDIHLELQAVIRPSAATSWDMYIRIAGNPKILTLEETMQQVLTPDEIKQLTACLRRMVETDQGVTRSAVAYLWAVKP